MLKSNLKDKLIAIGILIFSLTLFIEQLFSIKSNLCDFIKGFGIGLQLLGVILLYKKKNKDCD